MPSLETNLHLLSSLLSLYMYIVLHRLSQLEKLQVLDISLNQLGEVPEAVYSLLQLTELVLDDCGLNNISDRYVCMILITMLICQYYTK